MYNKRNIIYILDYDFGNGEPLKNRYLIVLDNDGNTSIVLSVVTSQDYVPDDLLKHGCLNEPDRNIHCHIFLQGNTIGDNGFSFPLNSFIYISSASVFKADSAVINAKYPNKVEVKDSMLEGEFGDLIYCIYKHPNLPRGIKRKLNETLKEIYD